MAFTQTDLNNIDAAMVTLAVDGFARVKVGLQEVEVKSIDELRKLRELVAGELVASSDRPGLGLRLHQIHPVYR